MPNVIAKVPNLLSLKGAVGVVARSGRERSRWMIRSL